MFLIFDDYFVNLANVRFIGPGRSPGEQWKLWIYQDDGGDNVLLPYGFDELDHSKRFVEAILRRAGTHGVCTGGDMDEIYTVITASAPERPQLVWVATVTHDRQEYGKPAVYVADSEAHLILLMRKQNGIPYGVDPLEWFEEQGMVAVWDSHYVEGAGQ